MRNRQLQLTDGYSFFVFGARGVGKSTLLQSKFSDEDSLQINLLDPAEENRFALYPNELVELVLGLPEKIKYVIVDEIQKVPKLLDVIHLLLETKKSQKIFILTGSSARKLKAGGANLLAGRAFVYYLYPFTYLEIEDDFDLGGALSYGLLPKIIELQSDTDKQRFLQAYALTYLKEEVWNEHLVKNLDPFRKFLQVSAQCNGKIINYRNIARDVGVDEKTVKNYFSILEDTLLAVILEPFQHSFRKRLRLAPKFYLIDVGIARALANTLRVTPSSGTSYYGELFESFIVVECIKLASYFNNDFTFSYLMTEAGAEIDLVVERPGLPLLLIEIKSSAQVMDTDLTSLMSLSRDLQQTEAVCFSNDPRKRKVGDVTIYPWQEGVQKYFK